MYKVITPIQLANVLSRLEEGRISFKAFRVYLACFELVAIREAAKRTRDKERGRAGDVVPFFKVEEIARLIGAKEGQSLTGELRALRREGLLTFSNECITFTQTPLPGSGELLEEISGGRSPARPIPVPRRVIRFIAACTRPALSKTMIAYMVRGLSITKRDAKINAKGTVKAMWIAEVFGLSLRATKSARAHLISLGWISSDKGSTQWKLNKTGAYFEINIDWSYVAYTEPSTGQPVDNSAAVEPEFAPPDAQNSTEFAPPYKDKKTSYESKNQKTQETEPAGVFKKTNQDSSTKCLDDSRPNIRNIKLVDLKKPKRLQMLHSDLVRVGEYPPDEASAINFVAAAVRAGRLDLSDERRVKVFLGIVKRRLWANITQAEEDRALSVLHQCREQEPGFMRAA